MIVDSVGVVVIGRNEGARLIACLCSARLGGMYVVYVDSGSSDGSVQAARAMGVVVVELDLSRPFTAARARNAGLEALLADVSPTYVQFIDGDCRLRSNWLDAARTFLNADTKVAVACGRRRERFPKASVYNQLCDQEWDTPVGEVAACGGDALMRVEALQAVGGFDPTLIAGEEPELCMRLRRAGWRVHRLGAEMTLHDAAMTRFGQFAKRMIRSGWAYAEGADRYGKGPERYNMREVSRIWLWGAIVPSVTLAATVAWLMTGQEWIGAMALLGLAAYPIMVLKIFWHRRSAFRDPWRDALLYGIFITLARPWQLKGMLDYHTRKARGGGGKIIEYKDVPEIGT